MRSGEAQKELLAIVQDPNTELVDAARCYRKMVRQHGRRGRFDWPEVTQAIIDRWSDTGLQRIQALAWTDTVP